MREVEYRVWDPNEDRMYDNIGIDKIGLYDFEGDNITEQEGLVIMQFTGLKNFYEGDIIKHSQAGWVGEIAFEDGSFMVKAKHETWILNRNRAERCEVIGNIFENLELLEGAEK